MSTKTHDNSRKHRRELLAFGYVRICWAILKLNDKQFPANHIIEMFSLWYSLHDEFYPNIKSKGIHFKNNHSAIYSDGYKLWQTGFGSIITNKNDGLYEWKLKITQAGRHNANSVRIIIGICEISDCVKLIDESLHPDKWMYCFFGSDRRLSNHSNYKSPKYGQKFENVNDVITVYLDMDKKTLHFEINGTKYRKAFDIEPAEYRLAVCICKDRTLQFV
eukprot:243040_1